MNLKFSGKVIYVLGLCEKFGDKVNLDRQNWTILKNKKYLGTLQKHHIQQRANTPGEFSKISEISESAVNEASTVKYPDIDYHIVRTPVEGLAERLTASLKLPGQVRYILQLTFKSRRKKAGK